MPRPVVLLRARARLFASARSRFLFVAAGLLLAACAPANVAGPPGEAQEATPSPVTGTPAVPQNVVPVPKDPALQGAPDITRAALIIPLSGPAAALGRDLADAAQMALFDFAVPKFELRIYDSGGNAQAAHAAMVRAQAEGARVVLGPLFSDAVAGTSSVSRPAGIPVFAFSNDQLIAGDGVYAAGFSNEAQIDRVVAFAARRGLSQFAALVPDDGFGGRMSAILSDVVARRGVSVAATAFYPGGVEAVTETVRTLARYDERVEALEAERKLLAQRDDAFSKRALERLSTRDTLGEVGFEALMLPVGGEEVLQIAPLLAFFDVDPQQVKLLGTWVWDDPALGKEPTMLGAWFAAPPPDARARFVERFEEAFGRAPDRLATLAYDGVALAAVLARGEDPAPYARVRLENPDGFAGVDGIFRLTESGAVERGLAVLEVRRDAPEVIDPAPTSFAPPVTN
ncbi:MAG: penicillin-binding protein activator [Proteobacteria bacterium]|nr:penicillin-binding protein activator [Pseudomonadota bacterium]